MNEAARAIATVIGRAKMNSPTDPVRIIIGMNEAMIVIVAARTGTTRSLALRQAAVHRNETVRTKLVESAGRLRRSMQAERQAAMSRARGELTELEGRIVEAAEERRKSAEEDFQKAEWELNALWEGDQDAVRTILQVLNLCDALHVLHFCLSLKCCLRIKCT